LDFENDINLIRQVFQPSEESKTLTISELIIDFFHFYVYEFKNEVEAIDIQEGGFSNKKKIYNDLI